MASTKTIKPEEMLEHASDAERYLKQMANKTRLMVMCSLLEGELSVSELLTNIPVTQPVLSQHLALLRESDMVATRREGQVIFYRLADERIRRTIELLYEFFCAS
ncbi:metalloregulator ArsR/SmtB family transcription factor [Alteromonas sp. H39]|uniref:metalloregulator ArsR/SmtB family transcription factor n=1 Tax=Alteromonas sp. H39 TaxID=3389876 RepID=UPI0039E1CC68